MNSLFPRFEFGESRKNKNILAFKYCRFWPTTPRKYATIRLWRPSAVLRNQQTNRAKMVHEYYHNIFGVDVRSIRYPGLNI
jgi:hypothetical protein